MRMVSVEITPLNLNRTVHVIMTSPTRLLWCPGDSNIPQNERVDRLAKDAAQTQQTSKHTQQIISISKLKQHTNPNLRLQPPLLKHNNNG
ncbi:hypothetical protein O181_081026 [Austropuccinia psidii MF-1]|uniref:RNase H type-1 domain-containing protein n=1 Tax=Austropuccinia psidii MF-1 TaxID=1389203 RepID=A0A9Q3FPX5_9BASI|nr:hypothetical protein [Austropuccinia psidii MF-1]